MRDDDCVVVDRIIDTYVRRLRRKLEIIDSTFDRIETVVRSFSLSVRAETRARVGISIGASVFGEDGETPVGSIFVIDASDRAAVDGFTRSDPYHVNKVWERVQIHRYNKKRGTPIQSRRNA